MAGDREAAEWAARRLVEDMALALQASLLLRHAPGELAGAFCAARLGDLPHGVDGAAITERALAL